MIKVQFEKLVKEPYQYLSLDDEYLPFSLKIEDCNSLPDTLYARNIIEENLIEFRFNKETKQLYEITLVSIQPNIIHRVDNILFNKVNTGFFSCIIRDKSEFDISNSLEVILSTNTLKIVWSKNDLEYYFITKNCMLGIDQDNNLSAVVLNFLTDQQIEQIATW